MFYSSEMTQNSFCLLLSQITVYLSCSVNDVAWIFFSVPANIERFVNGDVCFVCVDFVNVF